MIYPNTQNMSQLITPHTERLSKIFTALENILDSNRGEFALRLGGIYADPARREVLRCIRYVGGEKEPTIDGVVKRLNKAINYISGVGRYVGLTRDLKFLLERIEQAHKTNPTK